MTKLNRNDQCTCGSGKKYKKCCAQKVGLQKYKTNKVETSTVSSSLLSKIGGFSSNSSFDLSNRMQKTTK